MKLKVVWELKDFKASRIAAIKAIMKWPGRYETDTGQRFWGMPVSEVPSQLIREGWRNVSHLDESDFRDMGLLIVTARYVGGTRPKRFCRVVVADCKSLGAS